MEDGNRSSQVPCTAEGHSYITRELDVGKNVDIGFSGPCGAAPPMERDVAYPADPVDPRYAVRAIMYCLRNGCGHPACAHTHVKERLQNWTGDLPQNRIRAGGKTSTQKWLYQKDG